MDDKEKEDVKMMMKMAMEHDNGSASARWSQKIMTIDKVVPRKQT